MVVNETIIKDIQLLKQRLREHQINIAKAILFGSYANGTAHNNSDIDLALFSKNFSGIRFKDFETIIPYLKGLNPYFEIHPFQETDLDSEEEWFVAEIKKTGIEV